MNPVSGEKSETRDDQKPFGPSALDLFAQSIFELLGIHADKPQPNSEPSQNKLRASATLLKAYASESMSPLARSTRDR